MPDPGHAGPEGPLACIPEHQRQQPTAPAQPDSLANTQHLPTAPQGQDKPVRGQEHDHPALTAPAPLRSRPAKFCPRLSLL